MKRKMIAITAFMAVALAGCGQIDEPLTTTNSNNQATAQIEVQTASKTDAPVESTTETEETTSIASIAETQAEDNAVNAVSENNETSQPQAEEKQSVTETEKSATTASTTQAVRDNCYPVVSDNGQSADVFKMLDSLNYQAISCDGLPEYQITASDGTVYLINFDGAWVWRRPSLIADADNEAPLTREVIDAIYANWDNLNIVKTEW